MKNNVNKLINEKSPYLLQHAHNPVNWYPWSDEAFALAANDDKPVFLSIGYSTCHWCHVMEHESFEDSEVAELLNKDFIAIKVDKEERPDIDGIYMTICQMLTGSGGWPMTIIMTPEKKPFFAGTYFPKSGRFGRPGMFDLLPQITAAWKNKRTDILTSAEKITEALEESNSDSLSDIEISESDLHNAAIYFEKTYDGSNGGFGTAPKFPTPHIFNFLFRAGQRFGKSSFSYLAEETLIKMRCGGIFDQVGFGFHRYSTDNKWLLPHFEKMLYDQALMCNAYVDAFLTTKKEVYKKSAIEIIEYFLRDMTSPEGGFYSAEDADSGGEEGKFYLWKEIELQKLLEPEDFKIAKPYFHTREEGNFIDPMHGSNDGDNILNISSEDLLRNITLTGANEPISRIRKILFDSREKRIHPFKDDKILTDWNSLMITALCRAGKAFRNDNLIEAAENSYKFLFDKMYKDKTILLHRYKDGDTAINGTADDYAFFTGAMIELYEATFKTEYLRNAITLNSQFIRQFYDKQNGGFYFTSFDAEKLLLRKKEIYDGAIPSSNSIAFINLLKLARLTGNHTLEEKAHEVQKCFSATIKKHPAGYTQFLQAVDFGLGPTTEIVIVGSLSDNKTKEFVNYLNTIYIPNSVLLLKTEANKEELADISPFTKELNQINGSAAVYICENFICNLPVTNITDLANIIPKVTK